MGLLINSVFLLFFVYPLGQIGRIQTGSISLTALDMAVVIVDCVWLLCLLTKKIKYHPVILQKPIIIFVAICFLSLLINIAQLTLNQLFISFLYLLRWVAYVGIYFALGSLQRKQIRRLITMLSLSGGAVVVIGYLQFFFYKDLGNLGYLGWDNHLYRMFSSFLDPNFAACFFAFFSLFTFWQFFEYKNKKEKIFSAIIFFLTLIALILTYSRSGLLMFLVGIITFGVIYGNKKIIGGLLIITMILLLSFTNIWVEGTNPFRKASVGARTDSIRNALTIFQKNPVFGVGFNAFRYAQHRYGIRTSKLWEISHADAGTDSSFLFVAGTTGLIGVAGYLYLWYRIFLFTREKMKSKNTIAILVFTSGVGFLISSFFVNSLFYPMLMLWYLVILGIMERT